MKKITNYLLGQADKMTAWIGFIGLILLFSHFTSALLLLFIALIVLPEAQFSDLFKEWTKSLRSQQK